MPKPDDALFTVGDAPPKIPLPPGIPRVQRPVRNQVEFAPCALDSLVEAEHQVRIVWAFVEAADVSKLYALVRAFEGCAGRAPIDPRILFSLWLFATLQGVGSARQLDRLCAEHVAYRWLCGGVSVNHHTLADFRSQSEALFDRLLIDHIARLRSTGLVSMERVAHDGVRVRACAGASSFRSKETLDALHQEAAEQVRALKQELHDDPAASSRRERAARTRAANERLALIREALKQYPDVAAKKKDKTKKARVSVSDPDSRFMRMPDGGTRPAFNVQLSAETKSQFIVGAGVDQSGSDHGLLVPAAAQLVEHAGSAPKELLADGGFGKPEAVEELAQEPFNCTVYAPPTEYKDKDGNVKEPKAGEAPEIKAWRERMKTDEAKTIYKERASTIECVNALARNRGLQQFRVRGLKRVRAVVLLFALAHNLAREASLKKKQTG